MLKVKRPEEKTNIADGIDKALEVLECFSNEKPEWGITELSRRTGLGKSRVFRILKTLEGRGFAEKNPGTGHYRMGLKVFELGQVVGGTIGLRGGVAPILLDLSERTGGTSVLRILDKGELLTLNVVTSTRMLHATPSVGARHPIYYGACGKVFLAFMDPREERRLLKSVHFRKFTHATITSHAGLDRELEKVRRVGYALSEEETVLGVRAIALPVRDREGTVAASIGLSFPTPYFPPEKTEEIAAAVQKVTDRASLILGYRPRSP